MRMSSHTRFSAVRPVIDEATRTWPRLRRCRAQHRSPRRVSPRGVAILLGMIFTAKPVPTFAGSCTNLRPKGTARAAVRLVRMYLSASRLPTRGDILALLRLLPSMGRRQRSSEPAVFRKPLHCHGGASLRCRPRPASAHAPGSAPELIEPGGGAATFRPASRAGDPFDPRIPANGWVGAEPLGTGSLHHPARPASSFSRLGRGTRELPRHRNRFPQGQVGLKPGVPSGEATRMTIGAAAEAGISLSCGPPISLKEV
jgi:hypothetical protein